MSSTSVRRPWVRRAANSSRIVGSRSCLRTRVGTRTNDRFSPMAERPLLAGLGQPLPRAEQPLNEPDRPVTPGWLQYAAQRLLGRIASTPVVDPQQSKLPLGSRRSSKIRDVGGPHWITSSARSSSDCEIVMPSAFAVLRLMPSSNSLGCSTGRSAGLAPLRILSTNSAARLNMAGTLGP
jgi:hypothetical protein